MALPKFRIDVSRPLVLQLDDRDLRLAGLLTSPSKCCFEPQPVPLELRGIALKGEFARRSHELLLVKLLNGIEFRLQQIDERVMHLQLLHQ